jgi:uncharacterized repeat protein (TIGR01451 family)
MAGKMRAVAKLFLGTTVLATGGGAYYGTTHGWQLPAFMVRGGKASVAVADKAAAKDLDAVASAWAEQSSSHAVADSESSPIARSATLASPVGDRYAISTEQPTKDAAEETPVVVESVEKAEPVAVAAAADTATTEAEPDGEKSESPVAKTESPKTESNVEPQPTPAELEPVALASTDESAKEANTEKDKAPEATALARGQEPKDDPTLKVPGSANDLDAAMDAITSERPAAGEPRTLTPPVAPAALNSPTRNARQAFNNSPATSGSDRYGAAGALPSRETTGSAPISNPFNTNASSAASAPKNDIIQPLPTGSDDFAAPPSPPESGNGLRSLEGSPSGSFPKRDISPRAAFNATPSRDQSTNPYGRPMTGAEPRSRNELSTTTTSLAGEGTGKPGEKALEGAQQPTLVIQKYAPGEIQVGKPAKFVVQIRNAGAQSADNVTIHDEIPQGTKLISTSPNATTEGSRISWEIGKLSPGEDRTVEMQLMPISEGEIGSVATVNYSAQASVKTKCTMPQLAVRLTSPSEVMIGNQQHVKIEIKNPGTGDATGVILFENVPQNVKHVAGPALEFEIGTLRAGETRELDLVLTAEKAGKVINAITAKADGNLQVQQQVEFEVIAPALSIAVDGPERRYLERPATYEVRVENPGTAPAHNVQIVTKLPKGMRFVRANNMGEYDAATHAVYWSLTELPKGEKGSVELVAMPTETGSQTLQVEGHAQQGLSDRTQRDIVVEGLSAIMFEVRDLEDPIEVGGETGYEIRVVNQGTKAATNVQVVVDIPPGMKVISAEGEAQHKVQDGRLIFEPIQQLAPKADTMLRIRAQGVQAGDQRIMVQVNTDDMKDPIRREESTRVFGDQ